MAEHDGDWEIVKEGDRVIRRRVYTIPAPDADGAKATVNDAGTSKKKALTKHQRMLRQIKAQRELEQEQQEIVGTFADGALKVLMLKYLKILWILITLGGLLLYFYAPEVLSRWIFGSKPRLVDRSLMTIYPSELQVRKSLPLFFKSYAIARTGNKVAREAVIHVAELRRAATDPGIYRQKIHIHAWEHADFGRQMRNHSMDDYCGKGFREQYKGEPGLSSKTKRDDLLFWCLLANGHHDGYIKFELETIESQITRARKGVAVRYTDQKRIHSDSLLLLPLHDIINLKEKKKLPPSTMIAYAALEWLRTNAALADEVYKRLFEEFLFEWIEKEVGAWEFLNAACSAADRQRLASTERMIATTCKKEIKADAGNEDEEETCCTFHDPKLRPVLRHEDS
ncbi:hypothetical protein ACA910_011316 [Epithemia clementina (nom. ined.)]